ncbi:MAG: hypothetical protein JWM19_2422 [Actinomycetia bacterium]|nr:hypothetical protein [Actinomycetes bacterium]
MRDSDDRRDRFRALYEQHYLAVLRYATRRVAADAASDVVAETFLVAWRRLDDVPGLSAAETPSSGPLPTAPPSR